MERYIFILTIVISTFLLHACTQKPPGHAIATAHPLATRAGDKVLQQGGNAFDAAIAISGVLAVVEPYSSGFGGGGFWLLHRFQDDKKVVIDGRERAPQAVHADMYLDDKGDIIAAASLYGALAAGIPGMPAALVHLSEHYASRTLSLNLADAIRYAEEGFPADQRLIDMLKKRSAIINKDSEFARIFLPQNRLPQEGEIIRQVDLARTLRLLIEQGNDGFYYGQLAKDMVTAVKNDGGVWQMSDLANYAVIEREPIQFTYAGAEIISTSSPSSGGTVLNEILNIISNFDLKHIDRGETIHYLVEAMRSAYRDRAQWLGDSDYVEIPLDRLLSKDYAKQLAQSITEAARRSDTMPISFQEAEQTEDILSGNEGKETTHFSIIDKDGNKVAATLSINYPFGSGVIATGTGILLNNEMDDFVAKPYVPNVYGLVGGPANAIEPGKRMLSSMSPTFIDDGNRIGILGTPGGSRIITMVTLGILDFLKGLDAQTIVSSKRFHHQYLPDEIQYEKHALSLAEQTRLRLKGHQLALQAQDFGNMQMVIWDYDNNRLEAASDLRGIGSAIVR